MEHDISAMVAEIHALKSRIRPWQGNIQHSALVVTDMQNYFLSEESHACIPSAPAILPAIRQLIGFYRDNQRPVVFTRHVNDKTNAGSMDWWWKDLIEDGTALARITDRLDIKQCMVLTKNQYDAFHGTDLEGILRKNDALSPVFCGVMTNLCCETTVRSAFIKGFKPILPVDATATYNRELHLATFRNLAFGFSPVMTTAEVIRNLQP